MREPAPRPNVASTFVRDKPRPAAEQTLIRQARPAGGASPDRTFVKSDTLVRDKASSGTPPALRPSNSALPSAGERIRHYELIRKLGEGGMGSVFLARDSKLGRRVAIKFLHTLKPELAQRFIVEARTTAACAHENIVIIYEADEHRGYPYMVLEFLQGHALNELMTPGKPMPPDRAVELMLPVVRALASAHAQGIVHRDLKFDNVFVTEAGLIKVLDFGIAKLLEGEQPDAAIQASAAAELLADKSKRFQTQHGALMGTVAYMSPEQWGNGGSIDHRTDLWAAGIMLFQMIAGRHPLQEAFEAGAVEVPELLKTALPPLKAFAPDVPTELGEAVDRCLRIDKGQRMPDALALLRALEPFLPGRHRGDAKIDRSPYAGLSAFQEADADRFFGRTHEIAAMVNRLRDHPMIVIAGPSGAGKSSFVRAGLVPALKRSGDAWDALVLRPGRDPLAALASVIGPMVATSQSIADDLEALQGLARRLREEPGYAGSVLRSRARHDKRQFLLFIDQFEELFTQVPDAHTRLAFTACLAGIADDATSPIRVVMSIRSDFLDRINEDARLMSEVAQGLFFLTAPTRQGLSDALVQPAEMAGYRFEQTSIVEDMLEHLHSTQGALPLLQFTASQLWERRDPARRLLTQASYQAIGGIAGALASHADAVLNELSQSSRKLAQALFMRLVTPERTRAIVSLDEVRELSRDQKEIQSLVDQLVRARLLVVQTGGGGTTLEIVHESLIHSWPMLKRWLEESGEDGVFLDQLRTAAKQWQAHDFEVGLLWRGEMVEDARRFSRRFRGELPELQQRFLDQIFAHEAKQTRNKRIFTFVGVAVLVIIAVGSTVAAISVRRAQQEAEASALVAHTRLAEVETKEKERAEAARQAQEASVQLQAKNAELTNALTRAETSQATAETAQEQAEKNAKAANRSRAAALRAAKELKTMLSKEKERARRLNEQLGSPMVETLK